MVDFTDKQMKQYRENGIKILRNIEKSHEFMLMYMKRINEHMPDFDATDVSVNELVETLSDEEITDILAGFQSSIKYGQMIRMILIMRQGERQAKV